MKRTFDVVVVGAGPAGLAGALTLARARKHVVVLDDGHPRNSVSRAVHGFPTRDGVAPLELRRLALEELRAYETVELHSRHVEAVRREGDLFVLACREADAVSARRVLLATGITDVFPPIGGLEELWGRGVYECPYCHGYELDERRWGILLGPKATIEYALVLSGWTRQPIVLFTNGDASLDGALSNLDSARFTVERRPILRLEGEAELRGLVVDDGTAIPCDALFLRPEKRLPPVITQLGLTLDEAGYVEIDDGRESSVPGVHVAGDATGIPQQVIMAACDGALAAMGITRSLHVEAGRQQAPEPDVVPEVEPGAGVAADGPGAVPQRGRCVSP